MDPELEMRMLGAEYFNISSRWDDLALMREGCGLSPEDIGEEMGMLRLQIAEINQCREGAVALHGAGINFAFWDGYLQKNYWRSMGFRKRKQ